MRSFIIPFIVLPFFSCSKPNNNTDTNMPLVDSTSSFHTLILGTVGDSLVVWKDDTINLLHRSYQPQGLSLPGQMIAVGNDIYIAGGSENNKAVYYKNFVKTTLAQYYSYASSISVSNGNIYVAGFSMDNNGTNYGETYATYWKNGVRNTEYGVNTQYHQIYFNNNDMYRLGLTRGNGYDYSTMLFYKNNSSIALSNYNADTRRIAFKNDTSYVIGNIYFNGYQPHATLWKNGVEISIHSLLNYSEANAIFINGNDVYIAGTVDNNATLWKNGNPIILGGNGTIPMDIKVIQNDIYVVGKYYNYLTSKYEAVLWKNGIMKKISNTTNNATAFSILIQ
jgi:hypothetical protein